MGPRSSSFRLGYRALLLLALLWALTFLPVHAASKPKIHTVGLGASKRVTALPSTTAEVAEADSETLTLRVRPLIVDDKLKEWTTGEAHDVTDRTFAVRRAVRINDELPGEAKGRWIWERGPWLLIDRSNGHVVVLHPPDFDPAVSEIVWFRDYAAYCGVHATTKTQHLDAVVFQIGTHRPLLNRPLGAWNADAQSAAVCEAATWQRKPLRVTFHPTGAEPLQFDIVGLSAAMVEEADTEDGQ